MFKVSVIVPVYNSEKYLTQCIESLIEQTYDNIEIIIVNDGSTDNSGMICKDFEERDNRVKVFNIPNSGVSTARNIGIEKSKGDYITFVDSDDWVDRNMIEFAVEKITVDNSDIVMWSYLKAFKNEELKLPLVSNKDMEFSSDKSLLYYKSIDSMYGQDKSVQSVSAGTTWCKLYKKSIIENHNLRFNPILTRAQDTVFSIKAFNLANKITYYNKNLYHYRITDSSTSSGTRFIKDSIKSFNALLYEFLSFKDFVEDQKKFMKVYNVRVIKVLLWHLEHNYFHKDYKGSIFSRRNAIRELLNDPLYGDSIKDVEVGELPKKERTMVKFFRKERILLFYIVYKIHSLVTKFKKGALKDT